MRDFLQLLAASPVVPVLVIDRADDAEPLAEILVAAGIRTAEITLRTDAALEAIRRMARVPGLSVGAGTVLTPTDLSRALDTGSQFIVTPGTPARMVQPLLDSDVPVLPGVVTPTEVIDRLSDGFQVLKFFPAEQYGGISTLQALSGPFSQARFCPTGGVSRDKVPAYLALKNVIAVGGTWIAPPAALKQGDWATIKANAEAAAAFGVK
jgi:2-dehydro-3-deoxyphosphogluconate aldolase/(4S)-4-hydroxy-2-oxoglutarate aldolase